MTLRDEIRGDPAGMGYAALLPDSPGSVLDLLNIRTGSMIRPISTSIAQTWAASGPYSTIVDASTNVSHPCRASCLVFSRTLTSGIDIDLNHSPVIAMLTAWVATDVCTAAQRDSLIALSMQPASRAEILGLASVTIEQIIEAIK